MPVNSNGDDGDDMDVELERLRSASEQRERRLWELEAELPAALSRWSLLRSMVAELRPGFARRRPT